MTNNLKIQKKNSGMSFTANSSGGSGHNSSSRPTHRRKKSNDLEWISKYQNSDHHEDRRRGSIPDAAQQVNCEISLQQYSKPPKSSSKFRPTSTASSNFNDYQPEAAALTNLPPIYRSTSKPQLNINSFNNAPATTNRPSQQQIFGRTRSNSIAYTPSFNSQQYTINNYNNNNNNSYYTNKRNSLNVNNISNGFSYRRSNSVQMLPQTKRFSTIVENGPAARFSVADAMQGRQSAIIKNVEPFRRYSYNPLGSYDNLDNSHNALYSRRYSVTNQQSNPQTTAPSSYFLAPTTTNSAFSVYKRALSVPVGATRYEREPSVAKYQTNFEFSNYRNAQNLKQDATRSIGYSVGYNEYKAPSNGYAGFAGNQYNNNNNNKFSYAVANYSSNPMNNYYNSRNHSSYNPSSYNDHNSYSNTCNKDNTYNGTYNNNNYNSSSLYSSYAARQPTYRSSYIF
ncbi:hypothetical protein HELRODRAFT_174748 [Helobdella robusta]|uniref:Uncharacterized protein n=1 Tax=Helobdella robusta TaxID=6412 RepID=T1F8F5_HELRO|nr:hypothetical protein HELRODRAFT_174748 [Helobdella robusta]ESO01764.1 hypothetical protein HELRODRAFT_174748 [Helobdella robusta]